MHPDVPPRQPFHRTLYFQVLLAIVLGITLGHYFPDSGAAMKPLGMASSNWSR